jgi:hemerythrin-like domain-containing protein
MPITIGAKPDSPFTEPIGLMTDCHRRIEKFLAQLLLIAREGAGGPLPEARRTAFETALKYFQGAATLHTQDEEVSLFPRLRTSGRPEAGAALARIAMLEADHRIADEAHAEVDRLGGKWLNEGRLEDFDAEWLVDVLEKLQAVYKAHIAIEDNEVFPVAARLLDPGEIREVGREMAARRGLDPDHLPAAPDCRSRRAR